MKVIGEACAISEAYYNNNPVKRFNVNCKKLDSSIVNYHLLNAPRFALLTEHESGILCSVLDYYIKNHGKVNNVILTNVIITFVANELNVEIGYGQVVYNDRLNCRVITESKFFLQYERFLLSVTIDNVESCLDLLEDFI